MINAENVKYYERILSSINATFWGQLEMKVATKLCDGDKDLAGVIAEEFKERDYANLYRTKEGGSLVLKDNGKAKLFEKQGGFIVEYNKLNPPKTKAQKLNDYFYFIAEEGRVLRYEEQSEEEDNLIDVLLTLGLIKPNGSFYTLSREGLTLSYSGRTVQDFIKDNSATHQSPPSTVHNYNAPVFDRSTLSNSPVTTNYTNNQGSTESAKSKWWVPIIVAVITVAGSIAAKMLELF
ncbi:hypothetical protein I0P70_13635 [Pontibacter sp. FD36]|uniref:hypothetical protein n=1 Tax=Pontibacter sp. FD36 TaxID=2789860 RepID=UPI0018A957B8|nr:hypothetical protein [Pontibacter sp. FD36]MBF8964291.1 hypothetical protein [Pontibacter sp. FD36]